MAKPIPLPVYDHMTSMRSSFGPRKGPLIFGVIFASAPLFIGFAQSELIQALPIAALGVGWSIWLSRYRLTFTDDAFILRQWRRTVRVPYVDVISVRTEYLHKTVFSLPAWVVLAKDGGAVRILSGVFPAQANARICCLEKPNARKRTSAE